MKPAVIAGKDVRYLTSPNTGLKIPVVAARGLVFSAWTPSTEDLEAMKKGEPLWLVQRGDYIPEMHMTVGRRDIVVPAEYSLDAQKMLSPEVQHAAKVEAAVEKYGPAVGYGLFVLAAAASLAVGYFIVSVVKLPDFKAPAQTQVYPYPIR